MREERPKKALRVLPPEGRPSEGCKAMEEEFTAAMRVPLPQ